MNKNIISGLVVLIFAIVYTIMAFWLPDPSSQSTIIGPSVFPSAIGILLIITSVTLIISGYIEVRKKKGSQNIKKQSDEGEQQDKKKVFLICLILFGYISLFSPLGYLISTFLFILGVTMLLDRKHWIRNLIYSIVFPVTVYLLFNHVLSVYLPLGPMG